MLNKNSLIFILSIFLVTPLFAGPRDFFNGKTSIKNPFSMRDPFQKPDEAREKIRKETAPFKQGSGQYSNVPQLARNISFKQLDIVGVLIGKERRVIVRPKGQGDSDGNAPTFVVREGTAFPADNAVLKAIHPGGVILVERISNVYGQYEYLETVIPITK